MLIEELSDSLAVDEVLRLQRMGSSRSVRRVWDLIRRISAVTDGHSATAKSNPSECTSIASSHLLVFVDQFVQAVRANGWTVIAC